MIIGICGKSGSGKSTLSRHIKNVYINSVYLDIDKIGHNVLLIDEVKDELKNCFGNLIFENDKVDRKKLGEIVFNSRNDMTKLSDITWKYMQIEIDRLIEENSDKIVILDWILLYSTKYFDLCDLKILLDVPYEVRKERAIKRDNITEEDFDLREKASVNFNSDDFDYVINGEGKEFVKMLKVRM